MFPPLSPVVNQPPSAVSLPSTAGSEEAGGPEAPKPKKNRCFMCRKKVGLTGTIKNLFFNITWIHFGLDIYIPSPSKSQFILYLLYVLCNFILFKFFLRHCYSKTFQDVLNLYNPFSNLGFLGVFVISKY